MNDENPYQSPESSERGEYDWSLAKRILLVVSLLAIWYLACDVVLIWNSWNEGQLNPDQSLFDRARNMMFDWKALS